jgi:hypothetical protein
LRARTRFRPYRGHLVLFSCFARPDSFSRVTRPSGPVFMFCAPGLFFAGNEAVGSRFHVLRARTRFRPYRGHLVLFSCFARPDSFSRVTRPSGPVFMFSAPGLVFGGNEGVRVPFSCFALPDSFSAIPRASGPVFLFYAPKLVFGVNEAVVSHFHVLRARTRFRR